MIFKTYFSFEACYLFELNGWYLQNAHAQKKLSLSHTSINASLIIYIIFVLFQEHTGKE